MTPAAAADRPDVTRAPPATLRHVDQRPERPAPVGVPARPPFPFRMAAPAGWHALRGDAPSLRDDLLALVTRTALWDALDERRQRGTAALLTAVARTSAATGAVATLVDVDPGRPGTVPRVAAISLTWWRTAPLRADLDLARLLIDADEQIATGLGPGLVRHIARTTPDGTEHVSAQLAAPLPDSIWLALLTASASTLEHADALAVALREVATSLHVERPTPGI